MAQRDRSTLHAPRWLWPVKLIGIGIFTYLAVTLDHAELARVLSHADIGLLALSLVISIAALNLLKVLRWHLILRWLEIDYSYLDSYCVYQASVFIGLITPGRLGEMFRGVYLRADRDIPLVNGIATVGTDRMFDLFGMLLLAGGALLLNPAYGATGSAGWWFIGGAVIAFFGLLLIRSLPGRKIAAMNILGSGFMGRLVGAFVEQAKLLGVRRAALEVVITIAATTIYAWQCSLLAAAIGIPLDPLTAGGIAASVNLAVLIPVTVYGLGTRELTIIALLGFLGYSQAQGFSFALMIFINFWILGALWGMLFWLFRPIRPSQARAIQMQE